MRYGPELVGLLAKRISERVKGVSVSKIEGGSDWIVLHTKGAGIFISWGQDNFGVSLINSSTKLITAGMSTFKGGISLALSKHLCGGKISRVYQYGNDRILGIDFFRYVGAGVGNKHTLLVELMGRLSNLILLNEEGVIVEPAKHIHPEVNRYRTVLPGQRYVCPPPLEGIPSDELCMENVVAFLEKPTGIGKCLSDSLLRMISQGLWGKAPIFEGLRSLLNIEGDLKTQSLDGYITAWPWLLPNGRELLVDITEILSACSFEAVVNKKRSELIKKGVKCIKKEKSGIQRHIDGLTRQLSMISEAENMRLKGQAILAGAKKIPYRASRVSLPYWDESGNEEIIDIDLNPSFDPSKNAEVYFKKYKKFNADPVAVSDKLEQLNLRMEELSVQSDILGNIDDLKVLRDLVNDDIPEPGKGGRKKKETIPPHLRYLIGESDILVGLNEKGNRYVTFRQASAEDLWFHVHEMPGSHVILKSPPQDEGKRLLAVEFCASLALFYSKGSALGQASVDYTRKKHVRHISGAGPAQVTYKNSESITVTPRRWKELLLELRPDREEGNF